MWARSDVHPAIVLGLTYLAHEVEAVLRNVVQVSDVHILVGFMISLDAVQVILRRQLLRISGWERCLDEFLAV